MTELLKDSGYQQKEYLQDLLARYEYSNNPSAFRGKNGVELCSYCYIDYYVKFIYGEEFRRDTNFLDGLKVSLRSIMITVVEDIDRGISDNDYIKDENSERLLDFAKEYEKLDTIFSYIKSKIERLSWYAAVHLPGINLANGLLMLLVWRDS